MFIFVLAPGRRLLYGANGFTVTSQFSRHHIALNWDDHEEREQIRGAKEC